MTQYIFSLAGDHLQLAQDEVKSLFLGKSTLLDDARLILESNEDILEKAKRLGLTKFVCEIKDEIKSTKLEDLQKANVVLENSYRVDVVKLSKEAPSAKEIADALYAQQEKPVVNLHEPDYHYIFFWGVERIYFTQMLYENKDDAHARRSHLKEYNHPTSTHPRIAKAMINLSGETSFIDPFCGAGGIVLEGKLMKLDVAGSDIDTIMIKRARANASALGLDIRYREKDALELDEETLAIISDLPFGKNSTVKGGVGELYKKFLLRATKFTKKMVLGMEGSVDVKMLIVDTAWTLMNSYEIYVHKSMTRKIVVLGQN